MSDGLPIWTFVGVTLPLVLTPGASTAVILRNSIAGGARAGLVTAAGINAGSLCYGMASAYGFSVALQRWPAIWTVVRAAGLAYLAWLGLRSLRRAASTAAMPDAAVRDAGRRARDDAYEGLITNLLNPAIATFYLVLVPQFVPRGAPVAPSVLLLTAIHIALAASWHAVWAGAGATLARTLGAGRPRRVLEALSGIALLGLALKIALS